MPKLKTETIAVTNKAGTRVSEAIEFSVSTQGVFMAKVPEHLAKDEHFVQCLQAARQTGLDADWGATEIDKPRTHTYLTSKALDTLSKVMTEALRRLIEVEVTVERVILYSTSFNVSFVTLPDGSIAPNGSYGDGYEWSDTNIFGCPQDNSKHFLVGFWARVYDRTTYKRGDKEVSEYKSVSDSMTGGESDEPIRKLNGFPRLNFKIDSSGNGARRAVRMHGSPISYKEMPYTPEAAEFFANMLLSMCELARRFESFFGDKDRLQIAINSGAGLLTNAAAQEPTAQGVA